jgi:TPR repeat protein
VRPWPAGKTMAVVDPVTRAFRLDERGRRREAFHILLRAARRGETSAYVNLGYAYDLGRGVRRSKRKAVYWYRRAVALGDAAAAHNIATVYRDRGDSIRAAAWLQRAVSLGESGSNVLLGQMVLACLGQPAEALACFRAVGGDACPGDQEAGHIWAAVVEGMMASSERGGRRTRG